MKRKFYKFFIVFFIVITLCTLSGCDAQNAGDLKTLTHPYIAEYECVEAKLGDIDILDNYEYIKVIIKNDEELELCAKPKDGKKQSVCGTYSIKENNRELSCEIGIMGHAVHNKIIIENGEFCITEIILGKPLILKFVAK